jgi:hypothetical protein
MADFYAFAGEHPILTFLLAGMAVSTLLKLAVSTLLKLIPWSRRESEDSK